MPMRHMYETALVAVLLTACADAGQRLTAPAGDARSVVATEDRFQVVLVRPNAPANGNGAVAATLHEALVRVRPGGTIKVAAGTYIVRDLRITKAVTIEALGGARPVFDADGAGVNLGIDGSVGGPVTLRGIEFRNAASWGSNVHVQGNVDQIVIEGSVFHPPSAEIPGWQGWSSGVFAFRMRGELTVTTSSFHGGDIGVHGHDAQNVTVRESTFRGQDNVGVHLSDGSSGRVERNDLAACGSEFGCVGLFGAVDVQVVANTIAVDIARPVMNALFLDARTLLATDNTIIGSGGSRPADVRDGWPIRETAINTGPQDGTIARNRISGAFKGINVNVLARSGADVLLHDNLVERVNTGVELYGFGVEAHRNDVSDYTHAFEGWGMDDGDLTCNWWGSAAGPQGLQPHHRDRPAVYTPFAAEPIAGTDLGCG